MGSRKITNELVEMIRSGEAAAGTYLPSTRDLAGRYGVSVNTVHAAMKELAGLKLVECRPRRGAVVLGESEEAKRGSVAMMAGAVFNSQFESDWREEWGRVIWHEAREELGQGGFSTEVVPLRREKEECAEWLERVGRRPAGVVALGQHVDAKFLEALEERDIPWVSINRPGRDGGRNYVSADNQEGGRQVGLLFAKLGYERPLVLAINATVGGSDVEKVTGFFQGYIESGISTEGIRVINCGSCEELAGYRAVRQVLAEFGGGSFDRRGIFATGDMLATGAIHALHDEGMSVPQDVGVVGATGLSRSAEFDPPLTVLRQPMEQIGRTTGQMLVQMIREGIRKFAPRRIPCELILRESLAVPEALRQGLERNEDGDVPMETEADGVFNAST